MFDAKAFLNQTVNTPMATRITPPPEGEWTMIISTTIPLEEWFGEAEWKDKATGQMRTQATCKVPMEITDERAKALVKRDRIVVYYDMFLDLDKNGHLDTGEDKNVRLGALREALGQNTTPGWTMQNLWGAGPFIGKVAHKTDEKRDDVFAKVTRVARIR
jgi:hypothetical protein